MKSYDVCLSGPITGVADYKVRFAQAVVRVLSARPGVRIWNPAVLPEGRTYEWYMRQCTDAVYDSAAVVMLDGWEQSPGACAERALALALGIPVEQLPKVSSVL